MAKRRPRQTPPPAEPYAPLLAPRALPPHVQRAMVEVEARADPWHEEDGRTALSRRFGHLDLDRGVFNALRTKPRPRGSPVSEAVFDRLYRDVHGGGDTYPLYSRLIDVEEYLMAPDTERRMAALRRAPALQIAIEHWRSLTP